MPPSQGPRGKSPRGELHPVLRQAEGDKSADTHRGTSALCALRVGE